MAEQEIKLKVLRPHTDHEGVYHAIGDVYADTSEKRVNQREAKSLVKRVESGADKAAADKAAKAAADKAAAAAIA